MEPAGTMLSSLQRHGLVSRCIASSSSAGEAVRREFSAACWLLFTGSSAFHRVARLCAVCGGSVRSVSRASACRELVLDSWSSCPSPVFGYKLFTVVSRQKRGTVAMACRTIIVLTDRLINPTNDLSSKAHVMLAYVAGALVKNEARSSDGRPRFHTCRCSRGGGHRSYSGMPGRCDAINVHPGIDITNDDTYVRVWMIDCWSRCMHEQQHPKNARPRPTDMHADKMHGRRRQEQR
jgi:hypothetical protein